MGLRDFESISRFHVYFLKEVSFSCENMETIRKALDIYNKINSTNSILILNLDKCAILMKLDIINVGYWGDTQTQILCKIVVE